ncbi:hypothetical protein THAR02_10305 [Trichoderma harzianum]|uniref:Uncharacterized protein n=1 Tax=Trichoderma harzianum TaxID=5544 RepID=A0A0F9XA60_TRIHA|nr:hypothetical protein THAR02_10305 [Trichoderma harzianum]
MDRHNPDSQQWKPRHCRARLEGSENHNTPGGLQSTAIVFRTAVEAACYATLPGYGGRGTGRISALASFGGAGQTDSDATRKHWGAWYLSIYWYTTSIVAFHVECRGLQLRSTRRACQQVRVHARENTLRTRWGRCTLTPFSLAARSAPAHPYRERVQSTGGSTSSCHQIHLEQNRERKRSSATEWLPSGSRPHTPELLNTLTCHGQPPADLAIWGSSQLLLALPGILASLARPLALLSDGRDACGLQPQRPIWPRSPEARQESGKQKRSQRHGRLVGQGQKPARDWLPPTGLDWSGIDPMKSRGLMRSSWPRRIPIAALPHPLHSPLYGLTRPQHQNAHSLARYGIIHQTCLFRVLGLRGGTVAAMPRLASVQNAPSTDQFQ